MRIRPSRDHVLVKRAKRDNVTPGGIVMPDTALGLHYEGYVEAVGPGKVLENGTTRPVEVQVGWRVVFVGWTGTNRQEDGADYVMLREDDILAVYEDE